VLVENSPVPMARVGVEDTFGRSGTVPALMEYYGLTAENIVKRAKEVISRK
jgi:transketolase